MRIVICEQGTEYKVASNRKILKPEHVVAKIPELKDIAQDHQECFNVCCLNAKSGLISMDLITRGILNASLVHPREVFSLAIEKKANSIILVHNHPSGNITPSTEDIVITRNLIESGNILDIKVVDSVIIAPDLSFLSIREEGIVSFTS